MPHNIPESCWQCNTFHILPSNIPNIHGMHRYVGNVSINKTLFLYFLFTRDFTFYWSLLRNTSGDRSCQTYN